MATAVPKPVLVGSRAFDVGEDLLVRAKKQLQIATSISVHDSEIELLLNEAAETFEFDFNHVVAQGTFDLDYDCWPDVDEPIVVPQRPVNGIESVKYYDEDGNQQSLTVGTDYRVDLGRVWPVIWRADFDDDWPDLATDRTGLITVRYTAGYSDAGSLPSGVILTIISRVARVWHDRGFGDLPGYGEVYRTAGNKYRSPKYL